MITKNVSHLLTVRNLVIGAEFGFVTEETRSTAPNSVNGAEFGTELYGTELIWLMVRKSVNGIKRLRYGIHSANVKGSG